MAIRLALRLRHAWVALCVMAAPAVAQPDAKPDAEDDPRTLALHGARLLDQGQLDEAIAVLEQAQELEVTYEGCYALGQALRKKDGNCTRAMPHYRCAVERAPNADLKIKADGQIGRCLRQGQLELEERVVFVTSPPPPPPPKPPWYRDTAGGVLLGLGLGAVGLGGGLLVHAEGRATMATENLDAFYDAEGVDKERLGGTVSLSVGGALLVGSIVRYIVVSR